MLDVMKAPPPVIEQITWKATRVEMPDDCITVLIYMPDLANVLEGLASEPVWLGYWDSADETWRDVDSMQLPMVTWWAHLPMGPTEPKPQTAAWPA